MACTWDDAIDAKCRTCARDYEARIEDLEAAAEAGKRAAKACKMMSDALSEIDMCLDLHRAPEPYPGKKGVPCRVEALLDAWGDALQALDDLRRHPGNQAAMDHADAVLRRKLVEEDGR